MKKITLISILFATLNFSFAQECDSNCLKQQQFSIENSNIAGSQITTGKNFYYFTGTKCIGHDLFNFFSDGHGELKEHNSSQCP
jgi:hypothetical protein